MERAGRSDRAHPAAVAGAHRRRAARARATTRRARSARTTASCGTTCRSATPISAGRSRARAARAKSAIACARRSHLGALTDRTFETFLPSRAHAAGRASPADAGRVAGKVPDVRRRAADLAAAADRPAGLRQDAPGGGHRQSPDRAGHRSLLQRRARPARPPARDVWAGQRRVVRRAVRNGQVNPAAGPGRSGHPEQHPVGAGEAVPDPEPPLHD